MAWLVMGRVDLATAQPRTVAPIYWQQRLFFIPYQINRHDKSLRAVAKVQLLISRDGISDWRVLEQAEPNVQGFSYHAPEDGEYWFALRHLDQHGQPWPRALSIPNTKSRPSTPAAVQPQLRIMVDTHLPELELSGALNATGAVVVRYEARDASLRPETLVIEVRPAGGTWLPLNPGPPDVSHADRLVGRVEWNAPFGAGAVEVTGNHSGAASKTIDHPDVVTTGADRLVIAVTGVNDDETAASFTGETGGDFTLATDDLTALGTDMALSMQTAGMASSGTISGGTWTYGGATETWATVAFAIFDSGGDTSDLDAANLFPYQNPFFFRPAIVGY